MGLIMAQLKTNSSCLSKTYQYRIAVSFMLLPLLFVLAACTQEASLFTFDTAKWEAGDSRLVFSGKSIGIDKVTILNSANQEVIAVHEVDKEEWMIELDRPSSVPCAVTAVSSINEIDKDVTDAPADCNDGSIADDAFSNGPFKVLAANDLGMHCADLDYQIFSILPPFNVVHAQVIERGTSSSSPVIRDDTGIKVTYHAVSNPNDPVLLTDPDGPLGLGGDSINTSSENQNGIYKSNFSSDSGVLLPAGVNAGQNYTIGGLNYAPLYPGVQVMSTLGGDDLSGLCDDPVTLFDCPSLLSLFEPLSADVGIPVPSATHLYPASPFDPSLLVVGQQHMPGAVNEPQLFDRFDRDLPFFTGFDFGFRGTDMNWFAADGIPIMPVDDAGRSNTYPMMQVVARDSQTQNALASVDIVLPVASEADCQNCHVAAVDCLDPALPANIQSDQCLGAGVTETAFDVLLLDDEPPGETRTQQLLNTAKINILRLHDVKHGADYQNWSADKTLVSQSCDLAANPGDVNCLSNQTPVQCSRCHYSPALDLTQSGPVNEPEQGIMGRQQLSHISMSRAMHGHHGSLPDYDAGDGQGAKALFPDMPAPTGRLTETAEAILGQTCYQCHPGKRTQCLRGAMFSGGVVCQDCHGDMQQVGNDFTLKVASDNPADFVLDGSLRVPWATEPGCQSCHTGDAMQKNHPANAIIADDGIRLLQSYVTEFIDVPGVADPVKVSAIHRSSGSRFAENQSSNAKGETVDVLYRLSKGHGGVMCEGCHNSTHAIWPNQNPFANDNIAATQIQGHSGSIVECIACHSETDFSADGRLRATLDGPHGMHAVGDTWFANGGHEDIAEDREDECRACHGQNGEGSVLSVMATTRTLQCDDEDDDEGGNVASVCNGGATAVFNKGHQVTCHDCHENELD
jgi:hypothetical protein